MKTKALLLAGGLVLLCSCRGARPALVPEISPPLVQEEVCVWPGRMAGDLLFPCAAGVGWVDSAGKIVAWDVEKKTAAAVFALPFAVTAPPFRQGAFLVLKDPSSDHLLVYDLAGLTVGFESRNMQVEQILGVDRDCLVYLENASLVVHLWERPTGIFRTAKPAEKIFNVHFLPDRILILGRENLITFWKTSGRFQQQALPLPAVSPFFCDGEYIYYGDSQRHLVKFSLARMRPDWKLKLGQPLERQPFVFAGSIVANPADNNVLQLNGRGSVRWWLPLRSTTRFDLVPMSENLAAVLLNRDIQFIDLGRKRVTEFKSRGTPVGRPLALGQDLYFMLQEEKNCKLQRVGNFYGVEVEMDPAKIKWLGRSIRFSIQAPNLRKPHFDLRITDRGGETLVSKSEEAAGRLQWAWIPAKAGNYTLRVTASGLNRRTDAEFAFQVLDLQKMVPAFYLHF